MTTRDSNESDIDVKRIQLPAESENTSLAFEPYAEANNRPRKANSATKAIRIVLEVIIS